MLYIGAPAPKNLNLWKVLPPEQGHFRVRNYYTIVAVTSRAKEELFCANGAHKHYGTHPVVYDKTI